MDNGYQLFSFQASSLRIGREFFHVLLIRPTPLAPEHSAKVGLAITASFRAHCVVVVDNIRGRQTLNSSRLRVDSNLARGGNFKESLYFTATFVCRAGREVQRVQEGQLLPDPVAPSTSLPAHISAEKEGRQEPAEGEGSSLKMQRGNRSPPLGRIEMVLIGLPRLVCRGACCRSLVECSSVLHFV